MNITFYNDTPEGAALQDWWRKLQDDRGSRAELRRCGTLEEAALAPGTQSLCHQLGFGYGELLRIGGIAALAAHLEHPGSPSLAKAFAGKDKPVLSELRFRCLLQCQEREDLFPLLRRALLMLDRQANLGDLASSFWYWGDRTRRKWTFEYYRSLPSKQS